MSIKQETIQAVHELSIIDVAEKYNQQLKKAGVNYVMLCPFHNDSKPSFTLSPTKNIGKCFVCGESVNTIKLVQKLENLNFPDAVRDLAKNFNIDVKESYTAAQSDEDKQAAQERESLLIANNFAADYYHLNLLSLLDLQKFSFRSLDTVHTNKLKYDSSKGKEQKIKHLRDANRQYLASFKLNEPKKLEIKFDSSLTALAYIQQRFTLDEIKKYKLGYAFRGYSNLREYAEKQGFKREILLKAGLIKKKQIGGVERFNDNFINRPLIIPIFQKNKILGFGARQFPDNKDYPKYLNTSDTELYKKSEILYGLTSSTISAIKLHDKVYIVEGYTDVMQMNRIGVKNVVAKSGTSFTVQQMAILKRLTLNIILLDDGDNAGQKAMMMYAKMLSLKGCNVTAIKLPADQDPGSFFTELAAFKEFEQKNTSDYIVDIAASDLDAESLSISEKKKIKTQVADLLYRKEKKIRGDYIKALSKKYSLKNQDWVTEIRTAAVKAKQQKINSKGEDSEEVVFDNSKENFHYHNFYNIKKNAKGEAIGIIENVRTFHDRLKDFRTYEFKQKNSTVKIQFGFYSYKFENSEDRIFVQLKNGRIKKIQIDAMKEIFFKFIRLLKPVEYEGSDNNENTWYYSVTAEMIEELFLKKIQTLFNENSLILYPENPIKILEDTIENHYTFFNNCYAISDRKGCEIYDYSELKNGFVWEDNVLSRDFVKPTNGKISTFKKFVYDISGNDFDKKENKPTGDNFELYKALLIAGGYALHNFSNMERKAVLLNQGNLSEEDTSEGREGKTLFVDFLGQNMLNQRKESSTYVKIQGKAFQANDKHVWGDLEIYTKLVLFDDPPKKFDFEDFYNTAEDSFKVEKKHQANLYIQARLFIALNRPINRDSGSSRARSCVIALNSIFNSEFSPVDKYGHRFGRDWDIEEWNLFSWFVLNEMLPTYFENNCKLIEPKNKNLQRNELLQMARTHTGSAEIVHWFDTKFQNNFFKNNEEYDTDFLLTLIKDDVIFYKDHKNINRYFTKLFKAYLTKSGYLFTDRRVSKGFKIKITTPLEIVKIKQTEMQFEEAKIEEVLNAGDKVEEDEMPF